LVTALINNNHKLNHSVNDEFHHHDYYYVTLEDDFNIM